MPKLDGYGVCKALKERPGARARAGDDLLVARRGRRSRARLRRRRRRLPGQAGRPRGADHARPRARRSARCRRRASASSSSTTRRRSATSSPTASRARASRSPTAEDGQARARGARSAIRPQLIVTDYEMPRMTGFELVHALRRDPELRDIPVIMLTARDTQARHGADARRRRDRLPGQAVLAGQVRRDRRAHARRAPAHRLQGGVGALHLRGRAHAPPRSARRPASRSRVRADERDDERAVLRPRRLHADVGDADAARGDRAAQRLLRRDVPDRQGPRRRHRQVHRRRDHGGVRRRARPRARAPSAPSAPRWRCRRRCRRWNARAADPARDAHRHQHRPGRARRPRLARRAPRLHRHRRHREPRQPLREQVPERRRAGVARRPATRSAIASSRARSRA